MPNSFDNTPADEVNSVDVDANDVNSPDADFVDSEGDVASEVAPVNSSTSSSNETTVHETTVTKVAEVGTESSGFTTVKKMPARRWRSYWLIVPSAAIGGIGGLWLWALQPSYVVRWPWWLTLLAGVFVAGGLLGGAVVLERLLPSFKHATKLLERALNRLPMTLLTTLILALISGVSEEVFFRGALLTWLDGFLPATLALVLQALVFAAFHPMPRRAWSYTAYTFVAGMALGVLVHLSGHLWASIGAHALVNFVGFLEVYQKQRQKRARYCQL
jgi:membrane protease YdiL (CAAX protease family)